MPIYEYECGDCGEEYEELVFSTSADNPPCPRCASSNTSKKISLTGFGGSSTGSSCGTSGFT